MEGKSFQEKHPNAASAASLQDFKHIYAPNAEYHDMFIMTRGRPAVLCSFYLIALFWNIRWKEVGDLQVLQQSNSNNSITPASNIIVARVPFQVIQQLKLVPKFVQYRHKGWVDLHLQQSQNTGKDPASLVIVRHDDRTSWNDESFHHQQDILSWVLKIPILGSSFQVFRRIHGRIVEFIAEKEVLGTKT